MKKAVALIGIITLLVYPTVTNAAWWNPFTWKIFQPKVQTPIIQPSPIEQTVPITDNASILQLQAQIDELKKLQSTKPQETNNTKATITKTPTISIVDRCINLEGIQNTIPLGYLALNNICTIKIVKDVCPNLVGIQESYPTGMTFYTNINKCITFEELNELDRIQEIENSILITEKKCSELVSSIKKKESLMLAVEIKYFDLISKARLNPEGKFGGAVEQDIRALNLKKEQEYRPLEYERDLLNQEYVRLCN